MIEKVIFLSLSDKICIAFLIKLHDLGEQKQTKMPLSEISTKHEKATKVCV